MHIGFVLNSGLSETTLRGAENSVSFMLPSLAKGLLELRHEVSIIGRDEYPIDGARFIPLSKWGISSKSVNDRLGIDIIHYQSIQDYKSFGEQKSPYLITQHLNCDAKEALPMNTIFLSLKHAEAHGSSYFVHPGIDPKHYTNSKKNPMTYSLSESQILKF